MADAVAQCCHTRVKGGLLDGGWECLDCGVAFAPSTPTSANDDEGAPLTINAAVPYAIGVDGPLVQALWGLVKDARQALAKSVLLYGPRGTEIRRGTE